MPSLFLQQPTHPTRVTQNVLDKPLADNASAAAEAVRRMFENGESTEFSGMCVRALAADPQRLTKTGRVLMTGDLGYEYGLKDVDGRVIPSVRMLNTLLELSGHTWLAAVVPNFVRLPPWLLSATTSKY